MARTRRDRFFGAVNESYDAMLSLMEHGNERGYRASRTALREARKGEREMVGLARKWSEAPRSVFDLMESVVDVQARGSRRALELTREAWENAGEFTDEVQAAARRSIQANRAAGEITIDALRDATSRAIERVRGMEEEAESRIEAPRAKPARRRGRAAAGRPRARAAAAEKPRASRARKPSGRRRAASNRARPSGGNRARAEAPATA